MNDLFKILSRDSDMPIKRCERCGERANNVFYLKKGNKPYDKVSHDLCDACANWLCNFIAFFVTIEDDKMEEIEDVVSYDNPVYDAFVEEIMKEQKDSCDCKEDKEDKDCIKGCVVEKPAQKQVITKSVPKEVIEAADAFFAALAGSNPITKKTKEKDDNGDERAIKPVVIPIKDFLGKDTSTSTSEKKIKEEAPIVTRIKKLIADCKDDDFDVALKKITSFVGSLTLEDAKEFTMLTYALLAHHRFILISTRPTDLR